jgi:hypothetical protein
VYYQAGKLELSNTELDTKPGKQIILIPGLMNLRKKFGDIMHNFSLGLVIFLFYTTENGDIHVFPYAQFSV